MSAVRFGIGGRLAIGPDGQDRDVPQTTPALILAYPTRHVMFCPTRRVPRVCFHGAGRLSRPSRDARPTDSWNERA